MIKLFVTDIDGTILPAGSAKVPARNIEAVQAMVRAGVKVVIATGRMYRAALPIAEQLGVAVPIIAYNGALIKSSAGEILSEQYMDEDAALGVINFFAERGRHIQSYSNDELYVAEKNPYVELYEKSQIVTAIEVGWDGLRERVKGVTKFLSISDDPEELADSMSAIKKIFGDKVEVTRSHKMFAEFMKGGVSKAGAIKILAEKFGFDKAEILAIGDSENDLAMITSVGCGVAMGNAVPAVKGAVERVTDTCENFGFAKAVHDYVL